MTILIKAREERYMCERGERFSEALCTLFSNEDAPMRLHKVKEAGGGLRITLERDQRKKNPQRERAQEKISETTSFS